MNLLKDNLIPISSALIVGSLTFSFFNLMTPINRIKIRSYKTFFSLLGAFFTCALISSILPYIDGDPFPLFGYAITWNILSIILFIIFLCLLYKNILGQIKYNGNEKNFISFLRNCVTKDISPALYIDDILPHIQTIVDTANSKKNILACTINENNKKYTSWNIISLLSSSKLVCYMIKENQAATESIFKAYETTSNTDTNLYLIAHLTEQLVSNSESFLRNQFLQEQKYEIKTLFSKDFVNKYNVTDFIKIDENLLNDDKLKLYTKIYIQVLKEKKSLDFNYAFILDEINTHKLIQKASSRQYLEFDEVYTETLIACSTYNWPPLTNHYMESYFRRFDDFLSSVYEKSKKDDYVLHSNLRSFWDTLKLHQDTPFVRNFLNHLINKLRYIDNTNVYLVKIFILMENASVDFSFYVNTFIPHIKQRMKSNFDEFSIIENNLPCGIEPNTVFNY